MCVDFKPNSPILQQKHTRKSNIPLPNASSIKDLSVCILYINKQTFEILNTFIMYKNMYVYCIYSFVTFQCNRKTVSKVRAVMMIPDYY